MYFFQMILLMAIVIAGNYWNVGNFRTKVISKDCLELVGQAEMTDGLASPTTSTIQQHALRDYGSSNWCPRSTCHNSAICQPCKRRYLIIFASGRSASTTLTWMMDSLPGVRMSGENNDLLRKQFLFFNNTFHEKNFKLGLNSKSAFGRNKIPPGALSCILHTTIEMITPPNIPIKDMELEDSTIIGFKTIRSHRATNKAEMQSFVNFLKNNLPCARYLINYRSDKAAQVNSLSARFNWRVDVEQKVERETQNLKLLHELLGPEHAYLLDSTEWTQDVNVLNKALDWMGYGPGCHFPSLLEFNTKGYAHTKQGFGGSSIFANCTRL
jgi:hypothetical protein